MMPWEDEDRMIQALEAKGRTVCANIVRRIGCPTPDRSGEAGETTKIGSTEGESGLPRKGSSE